MKILFISIKGGSGSDVYYKLLGKSLKKYTDIDSDLVFVPHIFEKLFFLIPLYLKYKKINFDKYSAIHTNAEFGWLFKQNNIKLILTVHHNPFDKEFQKYTNFLQKIFYYLWIKPNLKKSLIVADKIVAVSEYSKKSILSYFGLERDVEVIYNGIDTDFFRPIKFHDYNDKKTKLLFVGNLMKRKGVDLLPQIMEKLGNDYEMFFTSGRRTKIPKSLDMKNMFPLGRVSIDKLLEEYNKCDILLFPSRLEGFGYCVAEAMSCGKPVVTTNYSSLKEIVRDGDNGYLCEINNIDDFVSKVIKTKEKLGKKDFFENNRDYIINNFSLKIMAERYSDFYNKNIVNL